MTDYIAIDRSQKPFSGRPSSIAIDPRILSHRGDSNASRPLVALLAVFVLVVTIGVMPFASLTGRYNERVISPDGYFLTRAIFTPLYICAFLLAALRLKGSFRIYTVDLCVGFITLFATLSYGWSSVPDETARKLIPLIGCTVIGLQIATTLSMLQQIRLYSAALSSALLLNVVFVVFFPESAISKSGAWRGFFSTKNELGRHALFTALLLLFVEPQQRSLQWAKRLLLGLSVVTIWFSESTTALFALGIGVTTYYSGKNRARSPRLFRLSVFAALVALPAMTIIVYMDLASFLGLFGKDLTFTGRTLLWTGVIKAARQHMFIGYGYGGFWSVDSIPALQAIYDVFGRQGAVHSHNGYLDVLLDLGIFGLVPLLIMIASSLVNGWRWLTLSNQGFATFPFVFVSTIAFYNLSEPTFIKPSSIYWLMLVSIAIGSARMSYPVKPIRHLARPRSIGNPWQI